MTADEVYLLHILERIERVIEYTRRGRDAFMEEPMIQDATLRNLEVIGEATKRLSPELRAEHEEVPWRSTA